MEDRSIEVPLPSSVEEMLQKICSQQAHPPPNFHARRALSSLSEQASLDLLQSISASKIRSLSAFIVYMAKKCRQVPGQESFCLSSQKSSSPSRSVSVNIQNDYNICSSSSKNACTTRITDQLLALSELEFRKAFVILSYIGRENLEDVMSAADILALRDPQMGAFEFKVWNAYGRRFCDESERLKCIDWDSGKTYLYHCHVYPDGSYSFKGPYLNSTRTHLQRVLGDENILIVKFAEVASDCKKFLTGSTCYNAFNKIAEDGIFVGLRRYKFFVFKDGGKEEKKKDPTSSAVKCYFVRMESFAPCDKGRPYLLSHKTVSEARCLFMHVHMASSLAKYMARFSLILSKTIKLQVDLTAVNIQRIDDIPCLDKNGVLVCNEDGEPQIHTDGTGYISEDLASKCPKGFNCAKCNRDENFERLMGAVNLVERSVELGLSEARTRELPLMMQVRLFNKGFAVKGTLLVNRQLPPRTIQIRPSMVKVETDSRLANIQTLNSLEVVQVSNQPKKAFLSRNLIALLSYGGVSSKCFLNILQNALEDAQNVFFNKYLALRAALNNGQMDDFIVGKMILCGIPLSEPFLRYRLSGLANDERKALKGGRLPISDSFYLMGTADPTGALETDEVCVILDNGQISGNVLVYRNPGLHFGDIHVLKAKYVKAIEDVVGQAKYGIFFSTKGQRSVANEIANGDFDGDMYWVSRNSELLEEFKVSKPWTRIYSTPNASSKRPSELSATELEQQLFQLYLSTRFQPSNGISMAADSWLAFMDRLLTLGEACNEEKECLKETMLKLIDMYYDAIDAPKSGKKVKIPDELKAEKYPHYMGRTNSYKSTSILGLIYDQVDEFQAKNLPIDEIDKLSCFNVEVPETCLNLWKERYGNYRREMTEALGVGYESKNLSADEVIKKYKKILYDADEFEESDKKMEEIYNEALAIYHVTYDYAKSRQSVERCNFAWKVAGPALCKFYLKPQGEKSILCSASVLQEILSR